MTEQAERFRQRIVDKLVDQTEWFRCPARTSTEGHTEDLASVTTAIHTFRPMVRCFHCAQVVSRQQADDTITDATLYVPEPEVR